MKLEDQVCSLELSKRLKELGVKQESLFVWHNLDSMPSVICSHREYERSGDFRVSAFTVAELIEMIPDLNEPYRISFGIENPNIDCGGKYYASHDAKDYPCDHFWYDNNLANCIAGMLIHLIENKLMEVKKCT